MKKAGTPASPDQAQFTGKHMLLIMLAFFGIVVAVNVLMAVAASSTWTGLVVANSYVASQEFQAREDAARVQRELGWRPALRVLAGRIQLTIIDSAGKPVELGEVTAQVNRPVGGREDRTLDLRRGADGAYEAPLALAPGVWELTVTAPQSPAGPFHLRQRISVQGSTGP
jgi:nitrogen fixation protein FixH